MSADRPGPRALPTALLLFAGTFALYAATRHNGFVAYDDGTYVAQNPHVNQGLSLAGLRWAIQSVGYACNWHPLTWISHMLDVSLFDGDAAGHHLHNACLHAANAVLLWFVLRAATGRAWPALAVAVLFAVQPQRVESVAWISERKDLLAGFYGLTAIGFHVLRVRRGRRGFGVATALALLLGLAAKPTLVTIPLLLVVLDRWPLRREEPFGKLLLEKVPLILIAALASALTLRAQSGGGCTEFVGTHLDLPVRLSNACNAYGHYLLRALWPTHLSVFYPHPATLPADIASPPSPLPALVALLSISAGAFALRGHAPALLAGWLWYLGTLAPMIGIVQVGAQAYADRYTYLPLIGIEIAVVYGWAEGFATRRTPRLLGGILVVLLGAGYALRTRDQIGVWRSTRTLFEHALAVTDGNYIAHIQLGRLDGVQGHLPEARAHFERACAVNPSSFEAQVNLAWVLFLQRECSAALEHVDRALALRPGDADAHYKRARILAALGRHGEAVDEVRRSLELDPDREEVAAYLASLEGRSDG